MKRVNSLEEYSLLLDEYLGGKNKIVYNHMLLPREIQIYIDEHKLFYEKYGEGGIGFICDENFFYKLYCFIDRDMSVIIPQKDKAQIVECIYHTGTLDSYHQIVDKLQDNGFKIYVENIRMSIDLSDIETLNYLNNRCVGDGLVWGIAEKTDVGQLFDLWSVLDQYNSIIPREEELRDFIEKKEIIVIKKQNHICAAARIKSENKKVLSVWLVAVDPSMRRKGMATKLYRIIMSIAERKGHSCIIQWCDKTNFPVLEVVKRIGFKLSNLESREYIKI